MKLMGVVCLIALLLVGCAQQEATKNERNSTLTVIPNNSITNLTLINQTISQNLTQNESLENITREQNISCPQDVNCSADKACCDGRCVPLSYTATLHNCLNLSGYPANADSKITNCINADNYCPLNCSALDDSDCPPHLLGQFVSADTWMMRIDKRDVVNCYARSMSSDSDWVYFRQASWGYYAIFDFDIINNRNETTQLCPQDFYLYVANGSIYNSTVSLSGTCYGDPLFFDHCVYLAPAEEKRGSLWFWLGLDQITLRGYEIVHDKDVFEPNCQDMANGTEKDNCYYGISEMRHETSICTNIESKEIRGRCYGTIGGSPVYCNNAPDLDVKESCYEVLNYSDISICSMLANEDSRSKCFFNAAKLTNNVSICYSIEKSDLENTCLVCVPNHRCT
ncbi:Uncharacterised protein [uncultured archaeon]|nr:Uncharacterised protein [uncultured archaeon]